MSEGFISKLKPSATTVIFRNCQGISNILKLQFHFTFASELYVNKEEKLIFFTRYQNASSLSLPLTK